jgi:hypothetical protein
MSYAPLDAEEAKAKKVLGADASFPKQKVDLQALTDKQIAAFEKFKAGRDEVEKKLEAAQDALDAFKNAVKVLAASYEASDFGLDGKKDAKKIQAAHKQFSSFFAERFASVTKNDKVAEELQRHLELLGKYKGPGK